MNKMKGFDAFERSLKNSLESYEVPYNSSDWARLEERMDRQGGGQWQASAGLYVLLLGGALAVGTTMHLLMSDTNDRIGEPMAAAMVAPVPDAPEAAPVLVALTTGSDTATDMGASPQDQGGSEDAGPVAPHAAPAAVRKPAQDLKPVAQKDQPRADVPAEPIAAKTKATNASEFSIKPSITEGCPGTSVEFTVNNLPDGGIHLWNFGDGSFSNQPNPRHTFSKAGTYEVMLSHSSLGGGNIHNKPVSDRIIIHEAPEASFNILKREFENTIPSVHFENRSLGGKQYLWDFGDGKTSTIPHPDHVYKKKGTYTVILTVTNAVGCVDRVERTVRIDADYDLMAPQAFSPNGDGVEDTFIPEALRTLGVKFQMSIFDRTSGQLIYETKDATRPWNGRVGNKGEYVPAGEYVWMVEMKDGDKLGGTYNGTVSLLR